MIDINTLTNPFPGLRSYEFEDQALFFGRESHIQELRNKLLDARFLALIGSSGSGKSSLIKAGLIPSLQNLQGSKEDWKVIVFRPGNQPVKSLLAALKTSFRKEEIAWETKDLERTEELLLKDSQTLLPLLSMAGRRKILIVVDQFEEVFRFESNGDLERNQTSEFINLLLTLINQPESPVHVVITMRSDYLDHCTEYKGLTEAINRGYYLLPKMNQREIKEVIEKPIETFGATMEPILVSKLLEKLAENPDFLPILQHVLMRTWDRWKLIKSPTSPISMTEYEAIGGMEESITQHAEEIYIQKLDEKRRFAAEKLFKTLIVVGANDAASIHPTALRDIEKIAGVPDYLLIDVVMVFRENGVSFLTPRPGIKINAESIIDVAVEKVLTLWDRSRIWIEEEIESAKLYKQLSYSALLYQNGRAGLWVNPELQVGLKWLKESEPTIEWAQRYDPFFERAINFLDYSKKQYDDEIKYKEDRQKRELRKARLFATVLGASSLVSLLFLIVAMVLRTQAEQSEKVALDKESLALAERKRAEDQTKEAITQKKIAEQQGVIAEQQKILTEEQKAIAVREQEKAVNESIAAKAAKKLAEEQKIAADQARGIALKSKKEAELQKEFAVVAQKESERQKLTAQRAQKDAEKSRNEALRQRSQAVSRFIAIQSKQMPNDDLAALLALRAYDFNLKNGGEKDNPEVYLALAKAAGANTAFLGHNDMVRLVAEPQQAANGMFVSAGDDGVLNLWNYNLQTSRPISLKGSRQTYKSIRSVAFTSNGKTIFIGSANGQIARWDNLITGSAPSKTLIAHDGMVIHLFMKTDHNKNQLISTSSVGQIRVWDIDGGKLDVLKNVNLDVNLSNVAQSPDGKYLFLATGNNQILRIETEDVSKKPQIYDFGKIRGRILSMAFTADGREMFLGSSLGTLYSTKMNAYAPEVTTLVGLPGSHTSGITKIAISPDRTRLATASFDSKIKLWNLSEDLSKQQPVVLSDFNSWVLDLQFTNDGKNLLAAGADKSVRVWDVNSASLYDKVLQKMTRDLTEEEWDKYIGKDIPYEKLSRSVK